MNLIYPDQLPTYHVHHHICAWCSVHLSWRCKFVNFTRTVFCSLVSMLYWSLALLLKHWAVARSFASMLCWFIIFFTIAAPGRRWWEEDFRRQEVFEAKSGWRGSLQVSLVTLILMMVLKLMLVLRLRLVSMLTTILMSMRQDNDAAARSMSSSRASSVMGSTSAVRFVQIFYIQIFCYQISW